MSDDLELVPAAAPAKPPVRRERRSFVQDMADPKMFGPWFSPDWSWYRWKIAAKVLFGEELESAEKTTFEHLTGRRGAPPSAPMKEAWFIVGRRGGKSLFAAAVAAHMARQDWTPYLKPGERGVVMVLAADKDQARVTLDYLKAFFEDIPALKRLVVDRGIGRDFIRLRTRITIQVQVASFRRIRGRTVVAAILDELAFWYSDENGANPDSEVLKALRPSMLTVPGSLLVAISSPYAKRGVLWDTYRQSYGVDDPRVLVWKASTETMNGCADKAEIAKAYQDDPSAARAEYGAEFREDLETFVSPEILARVTVTGRTMLPFEPGTRRVLFVDVAGGSGTDSLAACLAFEQGGKAIVARLLERRPPFSPEDAVAEVAELAREWHVTEVIGDAYAGDWPAEVFRRHGLTYRRADRVKSDLYLAFLPMVNSGKVELLDDPRSLRQLAVLERRTTRSGKPLVDHPPRGNDDLANVIAGACAHLGLKGPSGCVVATFTRSTDGTFTETGGKGAPVPGDHRPPWEDRSMWHPHERPEPLTTEADERMGEAKARRWRSAWGGLA